jgi:putative oxidoreductase
MVLYVARLLAKAVDVRGGGMVSRWQDWALFPIRLVVGLGLVYHGYPKLFSEAGRASFLNIVEQMGLPEPKISVFLIGVLEFGGGLLLVGGAFTTLVAAAILVEVVINLVVAAVRGGFPQPLPGGQTLPGFEMSLFYGSGVLALILAGPGAWSIDGSRARGRIAAGLARALA